MSTIDALTGTGAQASASSAAATASARSVLSTQDFYKIMISELTNQDPMSPLDNQDYMQQLASLQTLDATTRLTDGIAKLVLGQRIAAGSALIGHAVQAKATVDGTTQQISGTVQRVQVQDDEVDLLLDGNRKVKLEEVLEIA